MTAATRRGVAVTAAILCAVTVASFAVWALPDDAGRMWWQQQQSAPARPGGGEVVSDYGGHLEGVRSIHGVLSGEVDASFDGFLAGRITAQDYEGMAEAASAQVRTQMIRLVESRAPEEWHQSYISYVEALRAQNSMIRETIVAARAVADPQDGGALEKSLDRIAELRVQMESHAAESARAVPAS